MGRPTGGFPSDIRKYATAKASSDARAELGLAPNVDPDKTYSDVSIRQYGRYINDFRPFEEETLAMRDDTSLIDAVPEDVAQQTEIAKGIAERNRQRFGLEETAAVRQQRQAATQRGEQLSLAGGLNNARLAQMDANNRTLADLINIGQGVNRNSLAGLGTAAQNETNRKNAFTQAKASHRAQTRQIAGQALGTAAAIGMMLLI